MAKQAKPKDREEPVSASVRKALYPTRGFIDPDTQRKCGLRFHVDVYYKDPALARGSPALAIDDDFQVPWEPELGDGPTSARFRVVDYDATTGSVAEPCVWSADKTAFLTRSGTKVDRLIRRAPEFRQVGTWAILQNALDYFESPFGLGRRVSWAFAGNRLLVVPHAGQGANAFYDRHSRSLQFLYFKRGRKTIYTCQSSDIVNHELAHAVLDGIRPLFIEGDEETLAFHEFIGDFTAILMALRNTSFRRLLARLTKGKLGGKNPLTNMAQQFAQATVGRPYLRSAVNKHILSKRTGRGAHAVSEVLTGAMFEFLLALTKSYLDRPGTTVPEAYFHATQRMQEVAIQALDFLPPADATFADYATAVLANMALNDPLDERGYRHILRAIFVRRGILAGGVGQERDFSSFNMRPPPFRGDPAAIAASSGGAYRFLDDNRDYFLIPADVDLFVPEVFAAEKTVVPGRRLPRQIVIQYFWREEIAIDGNERAENDEAPPALLCGGTVVMDENGTLLFWVRKPGSEPTRRASEILARTSGRRRLSKLDAAALAEMRAGGERRKARLKILRQEMTRRSAGVRLG